MKTLATTLGIALAGVPLSGLAQGFNVYLGYQRADFPSEVEDPGGDAFNAPSSVVLDSVVGRFGYEFTERFGVEAVVGAGIGQHTEELSVPIVDPDGTLLVPLEIAYTSSFALFVKTQLALTDSVYVHGRIGGLSVETTSSFHIRELGLSDESSGSRSEAAAGVGIEYRFDANLINMGVRLDWTRARGELDLVSLSVGMRF